VGAKQSENEPALEAMREHVAELQLPQIACGRRAIVILEGPEGSGKKAALRQIAAAFDPCHFAVHVTSFDRREASEGHWLGRFWRQLPSAGRTSIFFRSWYRRVLDDRILGHVDEETIERAFDEINEFEAQQRDYGTLILKLYFSVSAKVQEKRLAQRASQPWRTGTAQEQHVLVGDSDYARALDELRSHSDTRWSPWCMIDGNEEDSAALAALEAIADAWSKAMPAEPTRLIGSPNRAA
jgi:polyphosphate kinase 2 (PPK2 family)